MFQIKELYQNKSEGHFSDIEISVLRVMHSRSVYGSHHKREDTIINSGFRSDKKGEVKKAIKSLIKKGYILIVKKSEKAITLNKRLHTEIGDLVLK